MKQEMIAVPKHQLTLLLERVLVLNRVQQELVRLERKSILGFKLEKFEDRVSEVFGLEQEAKEKLQARIEAGMYKTVKNKQQPTLYV